MKAHAYSERSEIKDRKDFRFAILALKSAGEILTDIKLTRDDIEKMKSTAYDIGQSVVDELTEQHANFTLEG
jgi:hypothetical protein